jgi:hypothetical protein
MNTMKQTSWPRVTAPLGGVAGISDWSCSAWIVRLFWAIVSGKCFQALRAEVRRAFTCFGTFTVSWDREFRYSPTLNGSWLDEEVQGYA